MHTPATAMGDEMLRLDTCSEARAIAFADALVARPGPVIDVDVRGEEPLRNVVALRALVDRLHDRAPSRPLVLSVTTNLSAMDEATCDWLVDEGALLSVACDGARDAHEANRPRSGAPGYDAVAAWLLRIEARFLGRRIAPRAAYVNGVVTVTAATIVAGAVATIQGCVELGLVYVLLRRADDVPPAVFLAFWLEAIRAVLARNVGGGLLVEKRLAMHLEARGSLTSLPLALQRSSCAACPHDPACGSSLLRRYLMEEEAEKRCGSPWCETSMGTFDAISALLASEDGAVLRAVYPSWMAARDAVMARLAGRRS